MREQRARSREQGEGGSWGACGAFFDLKKRTQFLGVGARPAWKPAPLGLGKLEERSQFLGVGAWDGIGGSRRDERGRLHGGSATMLAVISKILLQAKQLLFLGRYDVSGGV